MITGLPYIDTDVWGFVEFVAILSWEGPHPVVIPNKSKSQQKLSVKST